MLTGTYKKLNNRTFGAWVKDDYTGVMLDALEPGTEVMLTTRRGEEHVRIVASEVKTYKSGHVVTLVDNKDIAAKARERYAAKKAEFAAEKREKRNTSSLYYGTNTPCPLCHGYCDGDCTADEGSTKWIKSEGAYMYDDIEQLDR